MSATQYLLDSLKSCRLCPRNCEINRAEGAVGPCGVADRPILSKHQVMRTEEPFLSGRFGSGAIFLTGCVQACVFCQNYRINIERSGVPVTVEQLSHRFLELQTAKCHNIHWISPTHQLPWLIAALELARRNGLRLPIVFNTGGYDSVDILRAIEGSVDIYVPDLKFWSEETSRRLLHVHGYPAAARAAILEMKRQVGQLAIDKSGLAQRGLVIRHLLMPGHLEDAYHVYRWIAEEVGPETSVNIMPQYRPVYRATRSSDISRRITEPEWEDAMSLAQKAGLRNLLHHNVPKTPTPRQLSLNATEQRQATC